MWIYMFVEFSSLLFTVWSCFLILVGKWLQVLLPSENRQNQHLIFTQMSELRLNFLVSFWYCIFILTSLYFKFHHKWLILPPFPEIILVPILPENYARKSFCLLPFFSLKKRKYQLHFQISLPPLMFLLFFVF